jgi:fatty acid desaturase
LQKPPPAAAAREFARILAKYREPSHTRSVFELLITSIGFAGLWFMAWAVLGVSSWLSLLAALSAAGFLVRLFMIQHDCGHGAFFRHRAANDWLGRAIGMLTLTPYDVWRWSEETFWANKPAWNLHEAALHGSSHYELPSILRWFTANIGVHHVHHLCSRIPFY